MTVSVTVMPPSRWPDVASCACAAVAKAIAPTQDKARNDGVDVVLDMECFPLIADRGIIENVSQSQCYCE